jgi:hypothetical protein
MCLRRESVPVPICGGAHLDADVGRETGAKRALAQDLVDTYTPRVVAGVIVSHG